MRAPRLSYPCSLGPFVSATALRYLTPELRHVKTKFGKKKRIGKKSDDEIQENEPEYKGLRNSTLSDDSGRESTTEPSCDFEGLKNNDKPQNSGSDIRALPTKASSDSISEENSMEYNLKH